MADRPVLCVVPWPTLAFAARSLETGEEAIVLTGSIPAAPDRPRQPSPPIVPRERREYTDDERWAVVEAVDGGMSVTEASYAWQIPRSTIAQWVQRL